MTTIAKYTIVQDDDVQLSDEVSDDDYSVFTRDSDDDVMLFKHDRSQSLIDIYVYDHLSLNEQRFICTYQKIHSVEYKIDHENGSSTLMIIFDDGTNICSIKSCPIQFCNILIKKLFD
jgi:hypothetical protein